MRFDNKHRYWVYYFISHAMFPIILFVLVLIGLGWVGVIIGLLYYIVVKVYVVPRLRRLFIDR